MDTALATAKPPPGNFSRRRDMRRQNRSASPYRVGQKRLTLRLSGSGQPVFANGAETYAFLQTTAEASRYYENTVGHRATVGAAPKQLSDRKNLPPDFKPERYNPANGVPPYRYDVFGTNDPLTGHFFADFFKQGSASMRLVEKLIIVGRATSHIHDEGLFGLNVDNTATSIGTMVPAYGVSAAAVIGNSTRGYANDNPILMTEILQNY